jgi:adenosylmethionine-8-amino-7-oxononanoate aminotransferase
VTVSTTRRASPLLPRVTGVRIPKIARAEGVWLYGPDGSEYLDAISGSMTANLGYTNPAVVEAMAEAARTLPFLHESRGRSAEVERLAEELLELAPPGFERVYFTVSGAEAIEAALRIAVLYQRGRGRPERWRPAVTTHSYHGATLGALSATGVRRARADYEALLVPFPRVSSPFCFRCPLGLSYPGSGIACADELVALLDSEDGRDVAAFLFEPVIANAAGSVVPPPGYAERVRRACDDVDVVLIADEITTGLGRTGTTFAVDALGLVPDLLCVGKGLGVGYAAISAVLVHERVVAHLPDDRNLLGHNFNAHPIAVAVAREVLRTLRDERLVERARERGERLLAGLAGLRRHPIVGDVRGAGLLASVELVRDARTLEPFSPEARAGVRAYEAALDAGLLVLYGSGTIDGRNGDHLTLTPPFVVSEAEVDLIVERLDRALAAAAEELGA